MEVQGWYQVTSRELGLDSRFLSLVHKALPLSLLWTPVCS